MIDPLTKERATHEEIPHTPQNGVVETSSEDSLEKDTIAALFQDRDRQDLPESVPSRTVRAEKRGLIEDSPEGGPDPKPTRPDKRSESGTQETPQGKDPASEDSTQEIQSLKEELEKTQKRLTENQNYGRQNAQRLKTALKVTREFVEEGSLSEEEAAKLLSSLETDTEEDVSSYASHPFSKVLVTANKELENIRKYTDDDRLDDKVAAFDYFLLVAPKEEQQQALEDLTDLLDNPLTLAKKMLAIGQSYETSYREMKDAGGLQGMIATKDQTILNLRKNIDKLTKKVAQYEDYDKPRYRIDDHVGETTGLEEDTSSADSISSLFSHRDAPRDLVRQR